MNPTPSRTAHSHMPPHDTPILVTGERGCGKSSWCVRRLSVLRTTGARVRGVYSPAVFRGAEKVGIDLVLLSTGARHALARTAACGVESAREDTLRMEGPQIGPYHFSAAAFAAAETELLEAARSLSTLDEIIIDEIGPLELRRHEGFARGFAAILDAYRAATHPAGARRPRLVVVVRPELFEELRTMVEGAVGPAALLHLRTVTTQPSH